MITLTIAEALKSAQEPEDHYLYIYRDGEAVFYVGRSINPLERLLQHLGREKPYFPDAVGMVIWDNLPASLAWSVDLYTLVECVPYVAQHKLAALSAFQRELAQAPYSKQSVAIAEDALIRAYQPYLNVQGRTYHNPLPDRYIRQHIANAGVIPPSSPEPNVGPEASKPGKERDI